MMRFPWTITQLLLACSLFASSPGDIENFSSDWSHLPPFESGVIKERMQQMESIVTLRYNCEVESYLRAYLTYGYRDAEKILGNSLVYFPVIEYYLQIHNLPDALKFLPVIESKLNPNAISTAGATGIWQLGAGMASHFGLTMDNYVDERRDPYKSTQAALRYLARLYEQFDDWELALAAYNCGPGRVEKAIAMAGSTDFWQIRPYLPDETANFIPRFIAATYVVNYHYLHGLNAELPEYGKVRTKPVNVYNQISFHEVTVHTGVELPMLRKLNPMFKQNIIPANRKGSNLILPEHEAELFRMALENRWNYRFASTNPTQTVVIKPGDSLSKLAKIYNCTVADLTKWNGLTSETIMVGKTLIVGNIRNQTRSRA